MFEDWLWRIEVYEQKVDRNSIYTERDGLRRNETVLDLERSA